MPPRMKCFSPSESPTIVSSRARREAGEPCGGGTAEERKAEGGGSLEGRVLSRFRSPEIEEAAAVGANACHEQLWADRNRGLHVLVYWAGPRVLGRTMCQKTHHAVLGDPVTASHLLKKKVTASQHHVDVMLSHLFFIHIFVFVF